MVGINIVNYNCVNAGCVVLTLGRLISGNPVHFVGIVFNQFCALIVCYCITN